MASYKNSILTENAITEFLRNTICQNVIKEKIISLQNNSQNLEEQIFEVVSQVYLVISKTASDKKPEGTF